MTVAVDALQRESHHPHREFRRGRRQGVAVFEKGVRLARADLLISDEEAYLLCDWLWCMCCLNCVACFGVLPLQLEVLGKLCEVKTRSLNCDALSCTSRDDARSREVSARGT